MKGSRSKLKISLQAAYRKRLNLNKILINKELMSRCTVN